jgi:hypothetical protein
MFFTHHRILSLRTNFWKRRKISTYSKSCCAHSMLKIPYPISAGIQLAFLTMTNIRHFWVASNFHYPMQTIKTMWKAIFQNKLTIYKANLPSFVQKIIKSRCYVDLSAQTSAEMLPKNGGVRKANWLIWLSLHPNVPHFIISV